MAIGETQSVTGECMFHTMAEEGHIPDAVCVRASEEHF